MPRGDQPLITWVIVSTIKACKVSQQQSARSTAHTPSEKSSRHYYNIYTFIPERYPQQPSTHHHRCRYCCHQFYAIIKTIPVQITLHTTPMKRTVNARVVPFFVLLSLFTSNNLLIFTEEKIFLIHHLPFALSPQIGGW